MKAVGVFIVAALGFMMIMLGSDVLLHDQSLREAVNHSPDQFWSSLGSLFLLAWQYKLVSMIAFGLAVAILFVRGVPDLRNR